MDMGPLAGVKVIELAAIGPGPFCCMLLADMGADVIRIDRTEPADLGTPGDPKLNLLNRSRRSAAVDLKSPQGVEVVRRMIEQADVLVEGFRPGVTERLGLGPKECLAANPRLVYGRMTGWGQEGPLAQVVGHDINYIALAGALDAIGTAQQPVVPLNLVGDFGGGAMFLAMGIVAALYECKNSGKGQVVDAAMIDGVSVLMTSLYAALARGTWRDARGDNLIDGGAPFYTVYETSDGKHVAVGAIEGRFFRDLLVRTGIDPASVGPQHDRAGWPELRRRFTEIFKSRTRDEWCKVMEGSDACFAPVLGPVEAREHPHLRARGTIVDVNGITQPAPAPRFGRTPSEIRSGPVLPGAHTDEVLAEFGFDAARIAALRTAGAIA